jgi:tagaturonate reductase
MDRFRNPFIEHKWLNITVQYSSKMKMRVLPILLQRYKLNEAAPNLIALGFAAYIAFMAGGVAAKSTEGASEKPAYNVQDDEAGWFAAHEHLYNDEALVKAVLSRHDFWGVDLLLLPGFFAAVSAEYGRLRKK